MRTASAFTVYRWGGYQTAFRDLPQGKKGHSYIPTPPTPSGLRPASLPRAAWPQSKPDVRASLPAGTVLRRRAEQRLVNQKQYLEAKRLLKEFRARYRRLVRGSLRTAFGATPQPPARPALGEGPPKFGRFLEFMDEFCKEPASSDSKG